MAVDYITLGLSLVVFIFYLVIFFLLLEIRRKLTKDAGRAFIYLMVAVFFLIIMRLQQIFVNSDIFSIFSPVPYSSDIVALIFVIFFFMAVYSFYRSLKRASGSRREYGGISNYKRRLGKI